MPPAFHPDRVFPPWQVSPPAAEKYAYGLFYNSCTPTGLHGVMIVRALRLRSGTERPGGWVHSKPGAWLLVGGDTNQGI
ncbi:Uncharacterised protein [Sphingobacterium daejeonense]|nr:Uncharacterised protein [Sphingobacterium daejeonense]